MRIAPAGEHVRADQHLGDAARAFGRGDPAEQAVAGVRRAHAARPLRAVQREGVGRRAPRTRTAPRTLRGAPRPARARRRRACGVAQRLGHAPPLRARRRRRSPAPRTARSARPRASRPHGTPSRASPSTLAGPGRSPIAARIRRSRRRRDRRSDRSTRARARRAATARRDERAVAGARVVRAGEHDEQRRRVDAAVVASERHLAEARHLAAARLVQDLARARRPAPGRRRRLGRGQVREHAARQLRIDPQELQRGDDAVAAERRAEPGHAGVRIRAVRRGRGQHADVGGRATHPLIEALARALDAAVVARASSSASAASPTAAFDARGRRPIGVLAARISSDSDVDCRGSSWYSNRAMTSGLSRQADGSTGPTSSVPRHRGRGSEGARRCRQSRARAACRAASRRVPRTSKMSAKSASKSKVSATGTVE